MPVPRTVSPQRRRGDEPTAGMHYRVPPATRVHANEVARSLGITLGRYMEILIARDVLNQDGLPMWADGDVDLTKTIPMPLTTGSVAA